MATILCVDDNPDLVELLSELLKMMDYEVRTARGGEECLLVLEEEGFHPDLILLDIMMEPMDGWETLQHIRERRGTREIPVVMLTGKHPTMDEARLYGPMIDDYIMKPYHPREIRENIRQILARNNQVRLVVRNAEERGFEPELLHEYLRLASTIYVLNRLKGIISQVEPFDKEVLVKKEGRFLEIQEQFTRAGVQV